MLTSQCDRCGKPVRLQLHAAVQTCNACQQPLQLPPEMQARFARARDALQRIDVRKRQLTARQRSAISGSGGWRTLVIVMSLVVCLPFAGCAGFGLFSPTVVPQDRIFVGVMMTTPFLVMLGVTMLVFVAFGRAQRRLVLACAAVPPAAPGEKASCHVCGGPLEASALVARCSFCGADNVTTPDVMARRQTQEGSSAGDVESRVHHEAAALGATSGWLVLVTLASFIVVPLVLFIALAVVLTSFRSWQRPADESIAYTTMKTSVGTCVGRVIDGKVYLGAEVPYEEQRPPLPADAKIFHVNDLVGKKAHAASTRDAPYVRIEAVTSSPLYSNMATIDTPKAVDGRIEVVNLCLEP